MPSLNDRSEHSDTVKQEVGRAGEETGVKISVRSRMTAGESGKEGEVGVNHGRSG